jgi:glycosyltransferase A (GT-A) superfamily protein (DUF2064 family)
MTCLLVVAKAPVPGLAKTRLCPPATPEQAADIAAAALLDTVAAVAGTEGVVPVVAMTGDPALACRAPELREALSGIAVIPQRGNGFPARLANAHADVARLFPGRGVVQIGMDTPQVSAELLGDAVRGLADHDAVLGLAEDGGWWALGLRDPARAALLADIPTSLPDTGSRTYLALCHSGALVGSLPTLSDVDTMADAVAVAARAPGGRFAAAVSSVMAVA